MSTIGLLASTEKTVKLGRMHMRPFQWHLKTHWKYSDASGHTDPLESENDTTQGMMIRPQECVTKRVSPPKKN